MPPISYSGNLAAPAAGRPWPSLQRVAAFKVPADATAFDFTWLGQDMAKGTVGK